LCRQVGARSRRGRLGRRRRSAGEETGGRVVVPGDGVLLAGRYRLQDRIAAGGAGEVWRAADAVLGRAVAVKLLRPEYAGNGEMLARFRAEARYAALVCHRGGGAGV
jgi:serine/threonine protein kinase